MCINCVHYAQFLTGWKTFIVQCSYANAALLAGGVRDCPVQIFSE